MRIQWIQFPLLFISGEFFFQGLNFCLIKVRLIIDSDVVYKNATSSSLFFVSMIWLSLFVFFFFFHIHYLGQKERHKQCFCGMKGFWEL